MLFNQQVVLHYPGGYTEEEDDLGNLIPSPESHQTWPAWVEVAGTSEQMDAREQTVWSYTVYLPANYLDLVEGLLESGIADQETVYDLAPTYDFARMTTFHKVSILGTEYLAVGKPLYQPGGAIVGGYTRVLVERTTG